MEYCARSVSSSVNCDDFIVRCDYREPAVCGLPRRRNGFASLGSGRHLWKWLCEIHAKNKKLEDVKRVTMVLFVMLMETIKK